MRDTVRIAALVGMLQSITIGISLPSMAQAVKTESTETTAEISAFAPKYRERIKTYKGQINTGLSKGWLTPEAGKKLKDRLDELKTMEAKANANGYPKSELDNVEKAFTQFNIDLTAAENDKSKNPQHGSTTADRP